MRKIRKLERKVKSLTNAAKEQKPVVPTEPISAGTSTIDTRNKSHIGPNVTTASVGILRPAQNQSRPKHAEPVANRNTGTRDVYIGGVSSDNTPADITAFLKAEGVKDVQAVHPLSKKDDWQSFKITLSNSSYKHALNNIHWPSGVKIRPFHASTNKYRPKPIKSSLQNKRQTNVPVRVPARDTPHERQRPTYYRRGSEYQQRHSYPEEYYDEYQQRHSYPEEYYDSRNSYSDGYNKYREVYDRHHE